MSLVGHQVMSLPPVGHQLNSTQHFNYMFTSQWVERFSGIVSHVGVWHLAQSNLISVGFLNQSFWIRSLYKSGVEHKFLVLVKTRSPYLRH